LDAARASRLVSKYRNDLTSGFYETVIQGSKQILAKNDTEQPADVALYALGEAYVHYDFAGKNYDLSRYYFKKLIDKFPDSPLSSEARTYVSLLEKIDLKEKEIVSLEKEQESVAVARGMVEEHNFEEAVRKNLRILKDPGKGPPKDGALYNLGLIYAHIENPAKDYEKSQKYFRELVENFPESPLAGEARIWLGLFGVFEKMQQIDTDIEEQKKQLIR